ncbi:MAG: NmrA family NAD(P)-binding protein [Chloroflexota bacterium]
MNKYIVKKPLIGVVGCTGTLGSEVMKLLSKQNCHVRGILRHSNREVPVPVRNQPYRVGYVAINHDLPNDLARALEGIDSLFLLIGTNPNQVKIETQFIDIAKQVGVKRIIKMSAPLVGENASVAVSDWHREIEAYLNESGLDVCSIRSYAFMQNWLREAHIIKRTKSIFGSADTSPRNYVDCRDVAEVAVKLLLQPQRLDVDAIMVAGPEVITNDEFAERLTFVTGQYVKYQNLQPKSHYDLLVQKAGLPDWLAQHIVELQQLAVHIPEKPSDSIQKILGRYPRTMDEFLYEVKSQFLATSSPLNRVGEMITRKIGNQSS